MLVTLAATAAVSVPWVPGAVDAVPDWLPPAGSVTITTCFAFGLALRTGGRALVAGGLAAVLSTGSVASGTPVVVAAAAIATAVLAAVLGVMATKPAARFAAVVRECVYAVLVAVVGALAVVAYDAPLSAVRAGYVVLALSLLGALSLAYRLAAGLHGLGRRGVVMVLAGVGLLAVTLAYTAALTRWGSPGVRMTFEDTTRWVRDLLGAVPRPTEFLLGIPALAWGVSTRARRRQGWWGTAFGAAGLAVVSATLLDPGLSLEEAGLRTAYSLLLGLALGYLVIRADRFLSGARGRRARRLEEASAHRPEPGRTQALL